MVASKRGPISPREVGRVASATVSGVTLFSTRCLCRRIDAIPDGLALIARRRLPVLQDLCGQPARRRGKQDHVGNKEYPGFEQHIYSDRDGGNLVSWSLGCLTNRSDIVHGTSRHLRFLGSSSARRTMSNVGMSHVRSQMHLSNNQMTH